MRTSKDSKTFFISFQDRRGKKQIMFKALPTLQEARNWAVQHASKRHWRVIHVAEN